MCATGGIVKNHRDAVFGPQIAVVQGDPQLLTPLSMSGHRVA